MMRLTVPRGGAAPTPPGYLPQEDKECAVFLPKNIPAGGIPEATRERRRGKGLAAKRRNRVQKTAQRVGNE